jgi:hypothetical protein
MQHMATSTVSNSAGMHRRTEGLTIQQAVDVLSREERFMATVAAMNTLLIAKGIYTQAEFDQIFCRWAEAQLNKPSSARPGKIG